MARTEFTFDQLRKRYEEMTPRVQAFCQFENDLYGGMGASEKAIMAFVVNHLKLEGKEAEQAVARIMKEEIVQDVTPAGGEIQEEQVYQVNVIRRDEFGPWLGDWMVKANIKVATSRLGIFVHKIGSKGDIAEMGEVRAIGCSLRNPEKPWQVYICDESGNGPIETHFETVPGRVSTPLGAKSIVTETEVANRARLEFEFRFYPHRINVDDVRDIFTCAQVIGLGSGRSFEKGKFRINHLIYDDAIAPRPQKEKKDKQPKAAKNAEPPTDVPDQPSAIQ